MVEIDTWMDYRWTKCSRTYSQSVRNIRTPRNYPDTHFLRTCPKACSTKACMDVSSPRAPLDAWSARMVCVDVFQLPIREDTSGFMVQKDASGQMLREDLIKRMLHKYASTCSKVLFGSKRMHTFCKDASKYTT